MTLEKFELIQIRNPKKSIAVAHSPKNQMRFHLHEMEDMSVANDFIRSITSEEAIAVAIHTKYPLVSLCVATYKDLSEKRIIRLTQDFVEWYAKHYWLPKKRAEHAVIDRAYTHWRFAENFTNPDRIDFIKLSQPMAMLSFYNNECFGGFEEFKNGAEIQFLDGKRPNDDELELLLIEAYNFNFEDEQNSKNDDE